MTRSVRILFLLLVLPVSLLAQSRIDCSVMKSRILGEPVHYCVLLPSGYNITNAKRYPVLYFLHGLGQSEKTLFDTGGWTLIDDLRQQHKIGDFLLVAPEGKSTFYINSANGKLRYSDFFVREFMTYVEEKYGGRRARNARGITGVSMGGYGALRFAFAYPELFGSVSAQSAALMTESPQRLNAAFRPGAPMSSMMAAVFGRPVNVFHWRNNSPFVLARRNAAALQNEAIYFNCGDKDEYGFEKGAEILDRQLTSDHVPHEFHLYSGDHTLGFFLEHIGETLAFHSHAFAKQK